MTLKAVALTAHPVVIFNDNLPVESVTIKGREALVVSPGVNPQEYLTAVIPASGLPVPTVGNGGEAGKEILTIEGIGEVSVTTGSGGKEISDLPDSLDGTIFITSSLTSGVAYEQGRRDIYAPGRLVCALADNGSTIVLGCIGLKQG